MSIVACGTEAMRRAHHDSRLNGPHAVDLRAASAHLDERRGEVGVLLINHGAEPFVVERGERIAQLVVARYLPVRLVPVADLDATERGAGGFGSTGTA